MCFRVTTINNIQITWPWCVFNMTLVDFKILSYFKHSHPHAWNKTFYKKLLGDDIWNLGLEDSV